MPYRSQSGASNSGRRKSSSASRSRDKRPAHQAQPTPSTPGISSQMVRDHARRLFRDKWPHTLSRREWRLAERDLVALLEADAL